jgi:hypothetical protein
MAHDDTILHIDVRRVLRALVERLGILAAVARLRDSHRVQSVARSVALSALSTPVLSPHHRRRASEAPDASAGPFVSVARGDAPGPSIVRDRPARTGQTAVSSGGIGRIGVAVGLRPLVAPGRRRPVLAVAAGGAARSVVAGGARDDCQSGKGDSHHGLRIAPQEPATIRAWMWRRATRASEFSERGAVGWAPLRWTRSCWGFLRRTRAPQRGEAEVTR